jgi:glycerol-3-phosphate O-acyltransferase/dihydroxyacetone phosphate acyltransferase
VDLLSTSGSKSVEDLRSLLVTYSRLLTASRLSNQALTDRKLSLPNRFLPLWLLIKDTLASLIRLPFFLFPLITHIPIYIVGILGSRLVEDELETQAQMKIALGLVLSFLTYPVLFFTFWAIFRQVPLGFAIAAGAVFAMGRYHSALIDQNYNA